VAAAGKVEIMKLSKCLIVAGVLLLTACQSEQTPSGSSGVSAETTVAESFTQEDIREDVDSDERTAPGRTAENEEGTAPGKTEEEVPSGTGASGEGTVNTGSYEKEPVILNEAKLPDVFPLEFVFSSGAGAWRTVIVLNQDGSFNGAYLDSDMGDRGDDYPKGTHYICDFSGQFDNISQIDSHTYSMTLSKITAEKENGEEWIEDGILNKYSEPYGMEDGTEYLLYTPDTKIAEVPEEFLKWYPGWNFVDEDGKHSDTLSCYGIYNIKMGYGFFVY
jgi:hypothetical protein